MQLPDFMQRHLDRYSHQVREAFGDDEGRELERGERAMLETLASLKCPACDSGLVQSGTGESEPASFDCNTCGFHSQLGGG